MVEQTFNFLRPLEQFSDVNDYDLELLSAHCSMRTLGRHEVLLKCGDTLSCYVLKSGMLRVLVRQGSGFVELSRLSAGNSFGGARLAQGCSCAGDSIAVVSGNSSVFNEVLEIPARYFFKFVIAQDLDRRERWASSLKHSQPGIDRLFRLEQRRGGPGHSKLHKETLPVPTKKLDATRRREVDWCELKSALFNDVQLRARRRRLAENIPRMFHARVPEETRGLRIDSAALMRAGGNRKSNENMETTDMGERSRSNAVIERQGAGGRKLISRLGLLLERGVKIQSMQGAALHSFSMELEKRGEKAAEKKSTLSQSQVEGLQRALMVGSSVTDSTARNPRGEDSSSSGDDGDDKIKDPVAREPGMRPFHQRKRLWWDNEKTQVPSVVSTEFNLDGTSTVGSMARGSTRRSGSPGISPTARARSRPGTTRGSIDGISTASATVMLKPRRPGSTNGVRRKVGGRKLQSRSSMAKQLLGSEKVVKQRLGLRTRSRAGAARTRAPSHSGSHASPLHKHRWLATRRLYERIQANDGPHIGRRTVVGGHWHVFQEGYV